MKSLERAANNAKRGASRYGFHFPYYMYPMHVHSGHTLTACNYQCDEKTPKCTACSRREAECLYMSACKPVGVSANPSSLNADDVQTPPQIQNLADGSHYSAKHLLDLRLMHHYSVFTVKSFEGALRNDSVMNAMQRDIPQLALEHEFLMDTIFLVAMVHLACTDPGSQECLPIFLYRDQALRNFRQAVAGASQHNINAIKGASQLLAIVSFASDRVTKYTGLWVSNWLALAIGQRNYTSYLGLSSSSYNQENGPFTGFLYGSLDDIAAHATLPPHIQDLLPTEESDCDWTHRHILHKAAAHVWKLISVLEHPHEQAWLEKMIKAWAFDAVPAEFLEMTQRGSPRALLILAYYLLFLNLLPEIWIYEGVASHDIELIQKNISTEWQEHLSIPKMALRIDNKTALSQLLTGKSIR